jgi:hypothetical protein
MKLTEIWQKLDGVYFTDPLQTRYQIVWLRSTNSDIHFF